MQYGVTAATIKRAKLTKVPAGTEMDYKFIWEVNYVDVCGKKFLMVVHADTRYSMIFCDIKPSVWKNLQGFLHEAVGFALKREGFSDEEAERYFELAGEEMVTKTHGRKATGGMNHLTVMLPYFEKPLVEGSFQPIITDRVNRDLCTLAAHPEVDYVHPKEFFVEEMGKLLRK